MKTLKRFKLLKQHFGFRIALIGLLKGSRIYGAIMVLCGQSVMYNITIQSEGFKNLSCDKPRGWIVNNHIL